MKEHSWLYTKKHGTHRTDSRLAGILVEFGFASFCILAGLIGLIWLSVCYVIPEWNIHRHYKQVVCTLLDTRIVPHTFPDNQPILEELDTKPLFEEETSEPSGKTYKIPKFDVKAVSRKFKDIYYLPELKLKYTVDNVERTNWTSSFGTLPRSSHFSSMKKAQEFLFRWQKEKNYYFLYNPENPDEVVILWKWQWENALALTIPVSLLFMGIGIMIHVFMIPSTFGSKEYTAVESTAQFKLENSQVSHSDFPNIPPVSEVLESQKGESLYRLPMIDSPTWTLLVLVILTLVWNAGCVIFLLVISLSLFHSFANWLFCLYLIPFIGIGIWLVIYTLMEYRNSAVVSRPILEVSSFPLFPGKQTRVFFTQSVGRPILWLNILLICEEEVVFTHGTNTRREKQRVYQRLVFGEERLKIIPHSLFKVDFPLEIPQDAMHSFTAPHNQLRWLLIVQGRVGKFPMFERSFPIIVYPECCKEEK